MIASNIRQNNSATNKLPLVGVKKYVSNQELELTCKKTLTCYELAYETYGLLNADNSNAILVCHALTANHHAAGYHTQNDKKPGWWHEFIGENKAIDTNKFFVISSNNLGGCDGSTGPASINPNTNTYYGSSFPMVTVADWVKTQNQLRQHLGIKKWHAVIGGSLGGMQALQWSIDYPRQAGHIIMISAPAKLSAQNIAFNELARQAIMRDADFHAGDYLVKNVFPKKGLMLARMIGHITYIAESTMRERFGRQLQNEQLNFTYTTEFQIESYLHHQGKNFAPSFDANSYLLMTKALDYFDPTLKYGHDLTNCLHNTESKFLIISFDSDWRFAPQASQVIVNALIKAKKNVSYVNIKSNKGHDSFLLPIPSYVELLKTYLNTSTVLNEH